jgi:hypothetical protein
MNHPGYLWSLEPQGDQWAWRAVGREDRRLLVQGVAASKAEAAACLARIISTQASAAMEQDLAA